MSSLLVRCPHPAYCNVSYGHRPNSTGAGQCASRANRDAPAVRLPAPSAPTYGREVTGVSARERVTAVSTGWTGGYEEYLVDLYEGRINDHYVDALNDAGFDPDEHSMTSPEHRTAWAAALLEVSREEGLTGPEAADRVIDHVGRWLSPGKPGDPIDADSPYGGTASLF